MPMVTPIRALDQPAEYSAYNTEVTISSGAESVGGPTVIGGCNWHSNVVAL